MATEKVDSYKHRPRGGGHMLHEYLAELGKVRLLETDEERALWLAFKGEERRECRQLLIESYQPLVFKIALRLAKDEGLCAELIQEGTLGLIEAVEGFLPEREIKFSTYAQYRIRGRMLDFLRRAARSASPALELASREGELGDFLASIRDERVDVEAEIGRRAVAEILQQALERLSTRERLIIQGIYINEQSPQEIACALGISPSYLYKIQKKALRRLRGLLAKNRAEYRMMGKRGGPPKKTAHGPS